MGDRELALLRDLVTMLHASDADLSHAMLIFLPTYRTMELAHLLLEGTGEFRDAPMRCRHGRCGPLGL